MENNINQQGTSEGQNLNINTTGYLQGVTQPCPTCGTCPTCGQRNNPYYWSPYIHWYTNPGIVQCSQSH